MQRDRFRDWPAVGRWTVYGLLGLILALVTALIAGTVVVRHSFPDTSSTLQVPGLTAEVKVVRDAHGVPQIYADSAADLFVAQGYLAAQDRFWQMDVRRHITSGTLSEMVGDRGIETDQFMRAMGWHRIAEQEVPLLSAQTREALNAYTDGVNAWLQQMTPSQMGLEFTVLGAIGNNYTPRDWTVVDSLAWLKALAWDLSGNADEEIARARLALSLPPERLAELYPGYPYQDVPTVTDVGARPVPVPVTQPIRHSPKLALGRIEQVLHTMPHLTGAGDAIGSNAWAVSGSLTTSGAPILANDPHLSISLPGTFWQVGLHCNEVSSDCPYDVAGFAMAGFPGVVLGRNAQISWGITNVKADVVDLYLEKIEGRKYWDSGRWQPLDERIETIKVAGGADKRIKVRVTPRGPLLSDVSAKWSTAGANAGVPEGSPERGNGYAVALNWTALTPGRTADALLGIDRARDWSDFHAASSLLEAPALTLVYADAGGNIGAQVAGRIPIRRPQHSGDVPAAGWLKAQQPTGKVIDFEQMPTTFNPASGIVVSANQPTAGAGYPHRITDVSDYGFRASRIKSLLTQGARDGSPLRVADMEQIQSDTRNPLAPMLVPYLLEVDLPTRYYAGGQRLLKDWDYTQPADSAAAAYFNAVWRNLLIRTFNDELPPSARADGGSRWIYLVGQLLRRPASRWWDDVRTEDRIENRDDILEAAMMDARDELVRRQARDPRKWTWGHLHKLQLQSRLFTGNPIGRALFNRDGAGAPGGTGAINATAWDARSGYAVTTGPVLRMVVDLGRPDRSLWVNLAGQSGHTFAPEYVDQRAAWLSGQSLTWPWTKSAISKAAVGTQRLRPVS